MKLTTTKAVTCIISALLTINSCFGCANSNRNGDSKEKYAIRKAVSLVDDSVSRYVEGPGFDHPVTVDSVPDLIKALEYHDGLVRLSAAKNLEMLGEEAQDAVPALVNALSDKDEKVRVAAAQTLGRIGQVGASFSVQPLINALNDEDDKVRCFAAYSLGLIGPEAKVAIPRLRRMIDIEGEVVRLGLGFALVMLEPESERGYITLIGVLNSGSEFSKIWVGRACQDIGNDSIPFLVQAFENNKSDQDKRIWILMIIRSFSKKHISIDDSILNFLFEALDDEYPEVRKNSGIAIGEVFLDKPIETLLILSEKLKNEDNAEVRFALKSSLARINKGNEASKGLIIEMLADEDGIYDGSLTYDVLLDIGNMAVPILIESLGNSNAMVKERASMQLIFFVEDGLSALPKLKELALDDNKRVSQAARKAIRNIEGFHGLSEEDSDL